MHPGLDAKIERVLKGLDFANETLERFEALIEGFESAHSIVLLSTVHHVMHVPGACPDDLAWVTEHVHAWNEQKRERFPAWQVESAWQHLRDVSARLYPARACPSWQ